MGFITRCPCSSAKAMKLAKSTIRFAIRPGGAAADWQKAGVPILFCLKDTKEVPNVNLVLRHGPGYPVALGFSLR